MFVLNLKLNFKKIVIVFVVIAILSAVVIEIVSNSAVLQTVTKNDSKYDYILTDENYTEILKNVHENITTNVNKTIKMSGFVFRMDDFKEDIFVCGRNIVMNSEDNVAGFICQSSDAKGLKDNEWIEITGIFTEGEYNGSMPIIKISSIKKITAPANTFVK